MLTSFIVCLEAQALGRGILNAWRWPSRQYLADGFQGHSTYDNPENPQQILAADTTHTSPVWALSCSIGRWRETPPMWGGWLDAFFDPAMLDNELHDPIA